MPEPESKPIDILDILTLALQNPANGRIFTLMGPNGAGKSRLLESIEQKLTPQRISVLRLPANRSLMPTPAAEAPVAEADPITLPAMLRRQIDFGRAIFWQLSSIIKSVVPRDDKSKDRHWAWVKGGKKGQEPPLPLDQISQFQNLVGRLLRYKTKIELVQDPAPPPTPVQPQRGVGHRAIPANQTVVSQSSHRPELNFSHKGIEFKSAGLSDGEKQILSLAWMLVDLPPFFVPLPISHHRPNLLNPLAA
jgi:hypothetical protein